MIGKSRNPIVDLPFPPEDVLANIEMALVSHLHPDHFDSIAQQQLPKSVQIYCQPGDEDQIKQAGFSRVTVVDGSIDWHGVKITRTPGEHGNQAWSAQMGPVSGFILRAEREPTSIGPATQSGVNLSGKWSLQRNQRSSLHTPAVPVLRREHPSLWMHSKP